MFGGNPLHTALTPCVNRRSHSFFFCIEPSNGLVRCALDVTLIDSDRI